MSVLDRAALLAAANQPLPFERVDVPELGGAVFIRAMSGSERDAWEKSLIVGKGKRRDVDTTNVRAKLVCRVACDESGKRLLEDGDAAAIGNLRVDVLNKLFEVAQRLSGVSDADVEELGKPLAPAAGSDSSSSSV
jgi:hypothetical protein